MLWLVHDPHRGLEGIVEAEDSDEAEALALQDGLVDAVVQVARGSDLRRIYAAGGAVPDAWLKQGGRKW